METLNKFVQGANEQSTVVEVVFVPEDRDQTAFHNHLKKMPWIKSVNFDDENRKQTLKSRFGVCEIPTLVVIATDTCKVIRFEGRSDLDQNADANSVI